MNRLTDPAQMSSSVKPRIIGKAPNVLSAPYVCANPSLAAMRVVSIASCSMSAMMRTAVSVLNSVPIAALLPYVNDVGLVESTTSA